MPLLKKLNLKEVRLKRVKLKMPRVQFKRLRLMLKSNQPKRMRRIHQELKYLLKLLSLLLSTLRNEMRDLSLLLLPVLRPRRDVLWRQCWPPRSKGTQE